MLKKSCVTVVAGIIIMLPIILMGQERPAVRLAGLRVIGPGYGLNGTELRAFNQASGLSLAFVVQAPENTKMVEVDDSKCSLTLLTDDLGHNLLLDGVDWDGFPNISKDGQLALIEVRSKGRPARNSSRLLAKGEIRLRVAASQKTVKIENFKIEIGAKANVEQNIIQIMKAQKENDNLNLVLQIKRSFMNSLKDIRFYNGKGHPIEIRGRGSFTFGNASQIQYDLDLKSVPAALMVEIDIWQDLKIMDLPFEIDIGLGL
jgi:hypothetical protein